MNINFFSTDEEAELTGVWKTIGSGSRVRVARKNNPNFTKLLRSKLAKYTELGIDDIPSDEWDELYNEVLAETVLLDWEGLEEVKGVNVPYSKKKAVEWLTKYKEFKKIVLIISENVDNYRNIAIKATQDNIKK